MSLFSESLADAARTTATQGGDFTFGEKAGGVVAGAIISGLGSIYNTGVAGANALGADLEQIDTYNALRGYDEQWANYYKDNATAIDVAGFIAGSIVPGGLAVKGLNALRAGEATGAFSRTLNFARTRQSEALSAAMKELGQEGGSAFTRINKNKLAVMGWETADQALQAAVFETAVALTMKQSPLLADDSWWDIGKGIVTGAALGGTIGGGIMSLGINKGFKDAVRAVDLRSNTYTAVSGLEKLNLSHGDKAFGIIDSVLAIPDSVLAADKDLLLSFSLGSGTVKKSIDISTILSNTAKASTKRAMEDFELAIRKIVNGSGAGSAETAASKTVEPETAEALAGWVLGRYKKLKDANASPQEIKDSLGDVLFGLNSVKAATADDVIRSADDMIYFKKVLTPEERAAITDVKDYESAATRNTPFGKDAQAYQKPYIFLGNAEDRARQIPAIIGHEGEHGFITQDAAWKAGYSIAINKDGALRVNPNSPLWKQVTDPVKDPRRYINVRTGAFTDDTVLTAADRVVGGKRLAVDARGVSFETASGPKRANMMDGFKPGQTVEYVTARHAWASKLADDAIPRVIDSRDISLLERLKAVPPQLKGEFSIRTPEGDAVSGLSVEGALLRAKMKGIQDAFTGASPDIREVAYRFSAPESWVEDLIAKEFGTGMVNPSELANGMSRDIAGFLNRENLLATYRTPEQFSAVAATSGLPWNERAKAIIEQAAANGGQFVTGELAYVYRVQGAVKATQNAAAAVLGAEKIAMLVKLDQTAAKLADSVGSGASFLGAANASYGETLKLAVQDVGKHVHGWIKEASDGVVSALNTSMQKLILNPKAGAELGIVTNILRNDAGKFVELAGLVPGESKTLILRELAAIKDPIKFAAKESELLAAGRRTRIDIQEQDTMDFLRQHQSLNATRVEKNTVLTNARGFQTNKDPAVFYAPPIDTNYFQHFAFVRPVQGKAFSTSEVSMVFGRNAEELQKRMALIDRQQFDVITKDAGERYRKAKGDYDFDQTINERSIDSELQRTGALANFFPETRTQNTLEDYLRWHQNQESRLVRNAVESNYAQQVQELRSLGNSYAEEATSKFSGTLRSAKSEITNPYEDYIKTMLDVSKRSEYTFFHQANEFVDALGTRAYQMLSDVTGKAQKGLIPWEEANAIAEKHGIKGMYQGPQDYFASNVPRDRNLVKEYVAKANTLLANLVLRFDFAQSIMNVISTPLLLGTELSSIRNLVAQDSDLTGKLNELLRVKIPGQNASVPSALRMQANAIKNFFGPDKEALIARYVGNGDIKDTLSLYHSALDDLALSPNFKVFSDGTTKAADKIATLTGNNWAEQFTRFVSADVMRQLTEPLVGAGKMSLQEANAYISTFVNRVQGNYISSQRPVVFQGVLGGAIGLFQTYSFNLLQQLLRHVEHKDYKAVATMYGMQAGLFGLNGTPMFDAINTHIIGTAAINQGHHDAYSVAPGLLGKEVGDWLMYGTASAMPGFGDKWPALYSRGDINPRHMTILPTSLVDIPAIDASIRTVNNIMSVGSKLMGGADISETLLQGLEHNGINRPLAGMAQLLAGQTTTSKGAVIAATSDFDLVTTMARIAGSKPMDEAVALNNMYRLKSYQAADTARLDALGQVVKTKLVKNQIPTDDEIFDLMTKYAKIGGRVEGFNAALQRWMKDANVSVIEKMRANLGSTTGQRLNEIMGGVPLEDSRNTPSGELTPQ